MEKIILIDSSFLLTAVDLGKDLISSLNELLGPVKKATVKQVINELTVIAKRGSKFKSNKASLALKLAKEFILLSSNPFLKTDEAIIDVALKQNLIVATTDKELIIKLKEAGVPVVYVKEGILMLEGLIK